jgi:antitoxin component YwqK of YwqJK toxin-antitoxin module
MQDKEFNQRNERGQRQGYWIDGYWSNGKIANAYNYINSVFAGHCVHYDFNGKQIASFYYAR